MDENKLKAIVEEAINKAVDPINESLKEVKQTLQDHTTILQKHTRILDEHTRILEEHTTTLENHSGALVRIESVLEGYADSYKINQHNIERVDTRLTTAEEKLNIVVPEDLKVPHFSSK